MFSLNADYREGGLTEGLLSVINNIEKDDKVLFQIGIYPINDLWKEKWKQAYLSYRKGNKLSTHNNLVVFLFDKTFDFGNGVLNILDMFVNYKDEQDKGLSIKDRKIIGDNVSISTQTYSKVNYNGYLVQIKLFCNNEKIYYYSKMFDGILKVLDNDQELVVGKIQKCKGRHFDFQVSKNIFSAKELALFLQLPNVKLQLEYKDRLKSIEYRQVNIPKELLTGKIPIGTTTYKGQDYQVSWCENQEVLALPKVIIGPMNSGKSEYTKNFVVSAYNNGDSVIVLDFIKNCEMSQSIIKHINCIVYDLSKSINSFALAYPEIQPDKDDSWERLKTANILSRQIEFFINSLASEPLSSRMVRYLDAACKVVYIHQGKRISDVLNVLTNHVTRQNYIKLALESGCFAEDDDEIVDLISLHEYDSKNNITGTRDGKIEGILDRANNISKDIYLRTMMKAKIDYSINFTRFMDEGKIVIIQIPEHIFTNKQVKDTIITYFMSRIWLSALKRKNMAKMCHVVSDEQGQATVASNVISSFISESRKFRVSFFFTIHYLKQFKTLLDAIKSAGTSYMLLTGAEKDNFNALQEEFDPFEIDDLIKLKPYSSLNRINYGGEYVKFISKLPKPLS
jgi:hypothetical protein